MSSRRILNKIKTFYRRVQNSKVMAFYENNKTVTLGGAALTTYGVYKATVFEVEPEHIAVLVTRKGHVITEKVYGEGSYFMIPWFTRPVMYSDRFVRHKKCITSRNNEVILKFLVVANPVPEYLRNLFRQVGVNYVSFMEENIDKALNDVMPECNAKKFFDEEKVIVEEVKERLAERLDGNITVDKVAFYSIIYGPRSPNKAKARGEISPQSQYGYLLDYK